MSYDENIKKAPKIVEKNAVAALHDCVAALGGTVRPAGIDYAHLLSGICKTTGYRHAIYVDDVERLTANNLLIRIFSYLHERSHANNSEEVKQLAKEIIIEASRLYSNIVLNDTKPITKTTETITDDQKQ